MGKLARCAWIPCALTCAFVGADLALGTSAATGIGSIMLAAIGVIGAIVSSQRPDNPSGWLLSIIALSFAGAILGDLLYEETGAAAAAWVTSWIWVPAMVSIAVFPLVFPTGRPPTPRWRPVLWGIVAAGIFVGFGAAFAPGEIEDYPGVTNPVGLEFVTVFGAAGFSVLLAGIVASIAALVVRFRRSVGVERQQLKWVTAVAAVFPLAFVVPVKGDDAGFAVLVLGALVIAAAVASAILRYRLYDIDVVINRALVYGALTATLAGTYLVTVLLLQLVLPERSDLAVAASTLAVAAAFGPARRRIQATVDRRFFRARYDAALTLAAFGARLRDEVSLDAVAAELRSATAETLQPRHVTLWLRGAPR